MRNIPHSSLWARYLFFITATTLLFLGIGSFLRVSNNPTLAIPYSVYAVLMLGDAGVMLLCGLYFDKQKKFFWGAVFVLSLNIVLTIFDQFGLIDLLFSLLNAMTLAALFMARREISHSI